MFQDIEAKRVCMAECAKRNKHMGKHQWQMMHWRPLWTHSKGWFPALRPNH